MPGADGEIAAGGQEQSADVMTINRGKNFGDIVSLG
jgi:hypothetical protein